MRKREEMLDGVGLWKERKEWEEDGRNGGRCRIVEGRKGMLNCIGLGKGSKEWKEDGRNAGTM